jgi:hypothetical protein
MFVHEDDPRKPPVGCLRGEDEYLGEKMPGNITVRFTFQDTFTEYLAYPFYFLHEYFSHIYTANTGNQLTEDGWLFYAAHAFLKRQSHLCDPAYRLKREQVNVFEDYIWPQIIELDEKFRDRNLVIKACRLAHDIDNWLYPDHLGVFMRWTWALAACPAEGRLGEEFTNDLIHRMLVYPIEELIEKLKVATDLWDLSVRLATR